MSQASNESSRASSTEDAAECIRRSSRSRTLTEKGQSYHEALLLKKTKNEARKEDKKRIPGRSKSCTTDNDKQITQEKDKGYSASVGQDKDDVTKLNVFPSEEIFNNAVKQLKDQLMTIDSALDTSDTNLVKDESRKLDEILPTMMEANSKMLETMTSKQKLEQSEFVNGIELDALQKKQHVCKWLTEHNERRSKLSSKGRSSKSASKEQSAHMEANLLVLVNSAKDRLSRQVNLMHDVLATDEVDMIKRESANLDRMLSDLVDANMRIMEVIDKDQSEKQAQWMEKIDLEVFHIKQQVCTRLIHSSERSSSKSSRSSRTSK